MTRFDNRGVRVTKAGVRVLISEHGTDDCSLFVRGDCNPKEVAEIGEKIHVLKEG